MCPAPLVFRRPDGDQIVCPLSAPDGLKDESGAGRKLMRPVAHDAPPAKYALPVLLLYQGVLNAVSIYPAPIRAHQCPSHTAAGLPDGLAISRSNHRISASLSG